MSDKIIPLDFNPDWRIPPGEIIWEEMYEREISTEWLAAKLGMTVKHTWDLLHGRTLLDIKIAHDLAEIFGITPQTFLNLEKAYRKPRPQA
jgi:plasmid maintenance system antidote protein VapI